MTYCAESDQILGSVIAQSAPPLNVMDLKIFHASARLATPSVSLQNFTENSAISCRINPQAESFDADPFQNMPCKEQDSIVRKFTVQFQKVRILWP